MVKAVLHPDSRTKARQTLTDTFCSKVKPAARSQKIWDDRCPGLHLVVTQRGVKSLVFCVTAHGRTVWITLGRFAALETPDSVTMNVAKARLRAEELRQLALEGRDVRAKVEADREPREFSALFELYRRDYIPRLKPSTQASTKSLLATHVAPAFAKRLVPDVTYEDVDRLHAGLVAAGKRVTANRVRALLSRLFRVASKLEWTPRGFNPAALVEKTVERPRDRVLAPTEITAYFKVLERYRKERSMDPALVGSLCFCFFSGLRRSEVLNLAWSDVDTKAMTMTLRDHKRSKQVGDLVLPLNSHLLEILRRRKADIASEKAQAAMKDKPYEEPLLIFASRRTGRAPGGFSCVWRRLLRDAKVSGFTPHDLRRTFISQCVELGNPPAIADLLTGHSLGRIRDTYIVLGSNGLLAKASQATADRIAQLSQETKGKKTRGKG